ncbi:MAG TPA: 23S ribosomal RNA methyltransferase Erm [Solirubrobacterales bacterium]|jgi:23S rRNA (adenine-N6)-dimethyltransferase
MRSRTPRDERRRTLGQNFLVDERAIARVVASLDLEPGSLVLDLGAGRGALTRAAAQHGARVLAVEIDPAWARALRREAARWGDVRVVRRNALALRFPSEPFRVLASPPYGIATRIVRRLLAEGHGLQEAALVLQAEAARRLAGVPSTGRFAALWAPWYSLEVGARVPRHSFRPVPSVDSAVLRITPRARPLLSPGAFAHYERFIARVFEGRGRTVAERLGRGTGARGVRAALGRLGLDPSVTPSRVPAPGYAELFRELGPPSG